MRKSHFSLEQEIGLLWYLSDTPGTGGRLRTIPEDFIVEEISDAEFGEDGEYLICRLERTNWEQHRVIKEISRRLGISQKRIGIAGTKDRRAKTSQYISLKGISAEEAEYIRIKDVRLEALGRSTKPLSLGDLEGNRFSLVIRECTGPDPDGQMQQVIHETASGFPNYYGIQRFGVVRPVTHLVGRALLRGDYEEAGRIYVGMSFPGENEESSSARDGFKEDGDAKRALRTFPVGLRYERAMLHHIAASPQDWRGAFTELPDKLYSMFISAYQSYLFNHALSKRMEEGPLDETMEGDRLLFLNGREDIVTADNAHTARVHIKRGKCQLALRIPGADKFTPSGSAEHLMTGMMDEDGITMNDFREISEALRLRFSGTMRAAAIRTEIAGISDKENALHLSFSLGPGQYATTVCREIMKADPMLMI